MRLSLLLSAILVLTAGLAAAQIKSPSDRPVPSMPVFNPQAQQAPPPPTTQHTTDAAGNAVDVTTYYRTGPSGTYVDHTTTTTYPPGNPALGSSTTH